MVACGKNKRPGLSDKELFNLKTTTDTIRQERELIDSVAVESYTPPSGIKYVESRAIDPANPPVLLDLANRKLNIRKFDLSDYYTKVRYIKLKHPMLPSEGNFLFDANYDTGGTSGRGLSSGFSFLKDSIIAGDVYFGYHSYDNEGNFLNTIKTFNFTKAYDVSSNTISYDYNEYVNAINEGRTNNRNNNRFRVNNETMASYVYNWRDSVSNDFLFTFSLKGDTLCRFPNYNPKRNMSKKGLPISWGHPSKLYFYKGILTVNQAANDTVFRMTASNRLVPAYVINYGAHKLDIDLADDFSNKFIPDKWKETENYILFTYNKDRDSPNNRTNKVVTFFYSYFDKKSRQFYHFCEETSIPEQEFFMENQVPDALPFILSFVEIEENQLRVYYSKKRLENIIKNKGFASLSSEKQNELRTIQREYDESEVLIMILE